MKSMVCEQDHNSKRPTSKDNIATTADVPEKIMNQFGKCIENSIKDIIVQQCQYYKKEKKKCSKEKQPEIPKYNEENHISNILSNNVIPESDIHEELSELSTTRTQECSDDILKKIYNRTPTYVDITETSNPRPKCCRPEDLKILICGNNRTDLTKKYNDKGDSDFEQGQELSDDSENTSSSSNPNSSSDSSPSSDSGSGSCPCSGSSSSPSSDSGSSSSPSSGSGSGSSSSPSSCSCPSSDSSSNSSSDSGADSSSSQNSNSDSSSGCSCGSSKNQDNSNGQGNSSDVVSDINNYNKGDQSPESDDKGTANGCKCDSSNDDDSSSGGDSDPSESDADTDESEPKQPCKCKDDSTSGGNSATPDAGSSTDSNSPSSEESDTDNESDLSSSSDKCKKICQDVSDSESDQETSETSDSTDNSEPNTGDSSGNGPISDSGGDSNAPPCKCKQPNDTNGSDASSGTDTDSSSGSDDEGQGPKKDEPASTPGQTQKPECSCKNPNEPKDDDAIKSLLDDNKWRQTTSPQHDITVAWKHLNENEANRVSKITDDGRQGIGSGDYEVVRVGGVGNYAAHVSFDRLKEIVDSLKTTNQQAQIKKINSKRSTNTYGYLSMPLSVLITPKIVTEPELYSYGTKPQVMEIILSDDNYQWKASVSDFAPMALLPKFTLRLVTKNSAMIPPLIIEKNGDINVFGGPKLAHGDCLINKLRNVNFVNETNTIYANYQSAPDDVYTSFELTKDSAELLKAMDNIAPVGIKVHYRSSPDEWTDMVRSNAYGPTGSKDRDLVVSYRKRSDEEMSLQFNKDGRTGPQVSYPYEIIAGHDPERCVYAGQSRLNDIRIALEEANPIENAIPSRRRAYFSEKYQILFTPKYVGILNVMPIEFDSTNLVDIIIPFDGERYIYNKNKNIRANYVPLVNFIGMVSGYNLAIKDTAGINSIHIIRNTKSSPNTMYYRIASSKSPYKASEEISNVILKASKFMLTATKTITPGTTTEIFLDTYAVGLIQRLIKNGTITGILPDV